MMKIYLVIRGCYSDAYVAGVFSSKALAETNIALHDSEGSIEEYILDEQVGEVKKTAYTSRIDLESGEVFDAGQHETFVQPHQRGGKREISDFRGTASAAYCALFGRISVEVSSFESREHSLKLAAEARQDYLRSLNHKQEVIE